MMTTSRLLQPIAGVQPRMRRCATVRTTIIASCCLLLMALSAFPAKLSVGPSRSLKTPSAAASVAANGDTVEIDSGIYLNEVSTWRADNLTLRGTAGFAHLIAPATIPNGKAIWVIAGKNTVIEHIEFSKAVVPDQNGAGIRIEGGDIVIRHCYFHDNENGILGGSGSGCNVTIENSEFCRNGYGDGYSHNMYIGNVASFTLKFCYSHHAKIGHTVKSRARTNYLLYNRIMDEADGTASYEIDLPNGGTSFLIGNIIQQGPATDNPTIIAYGEEGLTNTGSDLYVINNTIVNDRSSGTFISIASGAARAKIANNLFVGSGTLISGPADTATNLASGNPGFADKAAYNYRPTALSPGTNRGSNPGVAGTFSLMPASQYEYDCAGRARIVEGNIDIGAFEFNAAGIVQTQDRYNVQASSSLHARHDIAFDLLGRVCGPAAPVRTSKTPARFIAAGYYGTTIRR